MATGGNDGLMEFLLSFRRSDREWNFVIGI